MSHELTHQQIADFERSGDAQQRHQPTPQRADDLGRGRRSQDRTQTRVWEGGSRRPCMPPSMSRMVPVRKPVSGEAR